MNKDIDDIDLALGEHPSSEEQISRLNFEKNKVSSFEKI